MNGQISGKTRGKRKKDKRVKVTHVITARVTRGMIVPYIHVNESCVDTWQTYSDVACPVGR